MNCLIMKSLNLSGVYNMKQVVAWNKILVSDKCGNYYDKNPCRAHTCNLKHTLCEGHKNLLEKRDRDNKGK